jgi:regulator of sirC expression with transglutaminase-like and TPR domain
MRAMVVAAILLGFAASAEAQTRLPRTSPSERQVRELNRSMLREQRQLKNDEQYQINRNQLKQDIDRQRVFSNPSPPARIGTCPRGSIGC